MSEYLPQEVLVEIFLRLPINSIIVCTSVCKSWYALITSPSFISTHLNNTQDDHLLVRYLSVLQDEKHGFSGFTPIEEIYALYCDNENFDHYAQLIDVPPKCKNQHFNIVGCCNGLLCLSDDLYCYPHIYYLWNPSIRKYVQLPIPIFTFWTHGAFDHTLGFGFDPVTNDYKVVRIVHTGANCNRVPPNVELYKLSTGVWQDITHVSPPYQFFKSSPGVYFNGACHWVAQSSGKIVLFDVHNETFRTMMLPSNVEAGWRYFDEKFHLFVSQESLCLADRLYNDDGKPIDIWRMNEYGDSESWVKHYSISSHIKFHVDVVDEIYSFLNGGRQRQVAHYLVKPITSRRNGEILWRADNGNLVSFDIATEKVKNLGIHNANSVLLYNALYVSNTYKASLVLLDKRAEIERETAEKYRMNMTRKLKSPSKHRKNDSDYDDDKSDSRERKRGRSRRRKSGKKRVHRDSEDDGDDKDRRKRRRAKRRKHDNSSDEDEDRRRRRKSRKDKTRRRSHRHMDSSAESSDESPPRHKRKSRRAISASDSGASNSDDARVGREKRRSEKRSRKHYDD